MSTTLEYKALLYTWGKLTPEKSRQNQWLENPIQRYDYGPRKIHVDYSELQITANLY